jgi:hypothetical protein
MRWKVPPYVHTQERHTSWWKLQTKVIKISLVAGAHRILCNSSRKVSCLQESEGTLLAVLCQWQGKVTVAANIYTWETASCLWSIHYSACHLLSHWFLAQLILLPWRWRRHVLPKHQLTFNRLYGVMSKKIVLFITTTVRTTNPTYKSIHDHDFYNQLLTASVWKICFKGT